ncbi:hypothetical protein DI09_48p170 [Mitosporidium daphniae]|uniref:Uncharacterized protein n=1 Tax=Mitosporidium daphniae TaxID=1485682 RepID=A0A098VTG7_9MICR|nr:uncharacterized protein DI09_48p170 [Mitosporidium daphniae]KGG51011.1 hypothetical protein DI09_48p170 [Mitosporidium daphniae]|eukprot:XP_013237438.1 uncharacterized protein DI09_48p170 [Mitosporidium daphniae]
MQRNGNPVLIALCSNRICQINSGVPPCLPSLLSEAFILVGAKMPESDARYAWSCLSTGAFARASHFYSKWEEAGCPLGQFLCIYFDLLKLERETSQCVTLDFRCVSKEYYYSKVVQWRSALKNALFPLLGRTEVALSKSSEGIARAFLLFLNKAAASFRASLVQYAGNWSCWYYLSQTISGAEQIICHKELIPCFEAGESSLEKYSSMLNGFPEHYKASQFIRLFVLENEILKRTKSASASTSFLPLVQSFLDMTISNYSLEGFDILANLLFLSEDFVSLELLAARAKSIDERSAVALIVVGNLFSLNGDSQAALDMFSRALTVDPGYSMAWTLSGHELVQSKRLDEAIDRYRCALEDRPAAIYCFRKAKELRPEDPRMWTALGSVLEENFHQNHAYPDALLQSNSANAYLTALLVEIFKFWEVSLPGIYEARLEAAGALAELYLNVNGFCATKMDRFPLSLLKCFVNGKLFLDNSKKYNQARVALLND